MNIPVNILIWMTFESTQSGFDLLNPFPWNLASTPFEDKFPEATLVNNIDYGKNRALLSWYYIGRYFFKKEFKPYAISS